MESLQGHRSGAVYSKPGKAAAQAVRYYAPFVRTYDAVVHDWQHSSDFAGLRVSVPDNVAWGIAASRIEEAVVVDARDVQFVILSHQDELTNYFRQHPKVELLSVTSDGVKGVSWRRDSLYQRDWLQQAVDSPYEPSNENLE